jgi:hypothetical protein
MSDGILHNEADGSCLAPQQHCTPRPAFLAQPAGRSRRKRFAIAKLGLIFRSVEN